MRDSSLPVSGSAAMQQPCELRWDLMSSWQLQAVHQQFSTAFTAEHCQPVLVRAQRHTLTGASLWSHAAGSTEQGSCLTPFGSSCWPSTGPVLCSAPDSPLHTSCLPSCGAMGPQRGQQAVAARLHGVRPCRCTMFASQLRELWDAPAGRQCMACCFHLLRQWEDVLVYLSSIRSYLAEDDDFNWNFGIASAAGEQWGDAEEGLLAVRSEAYCGEHCYAMWLARTHIMQGGCCLSGSQNVMLGHSLEVELRRGQPHHAGWVLLVGWPECHARSEFGGGAASWPTPSCGVGLACEGGLDDMQIRASEVHLELGRRAQPCDVPGQGAHTAG